MVCKNLLFSDHCISQMFKRRILLAEVKSLLTSSEIIKEYTDDKPYPSFLLPGFVSNRPLHLLVAKDEETENCIMVTVYEPDKNIWKNDFKTKIQ